MLQSEISWKNLSAHHDKPYIFVISQWQKQPRGSVPYLVYRWTIAAFFTFMLIFSVMKGKDDTPINQARWLIYFTHWGSIICTFQAILVAVLVSKYVCGRNESKFENSSMKSYKIYWLSNGLATDLSLLITVMYWTLLFNPRTHKIDINNYFMHANTGCLMLLDLFIVAHPIRLLHAIYPILMSLVYGMFTIIYYEAGGVSLSGKEYIYSFINWAKPLSAVSFCGITMGIIAIFHTFTWSVYKFRTWIFTKCCPLDQNNGYNSEIDAKESFLRLSA